MLRKALLTLGRLYPCVNASRCCMFESMLHLYCALDLAPLAFLTVLEDMLHDHSL